jgi:inorganic pyrophosphatase
MPEPIIGVIEIPKGSQNKYELNKELGELELDRVIGMKYPYNYGFIPQTLSDDGDPVDVFVLGDEPIPPLTRVKLEVLDVIHMVDNGKNDEKLVCKIAGTETTDMLRWQLAEIKCFLTSYKSGTSIIPVNRENDAMRTLEEGAVRYASEKVAVEDHANDGRNAKLRKIEDLAERISHGCDGSYARKYAAEIVEIVNELEKQ